MAWRNVQQVDAKVGDEILVDARRAGGPLRAGEIVGIVDRGGIVQYIVRRDGGGVQYVVRWDDQRSTA